MSESDEPTRYCGKPAAALYATFRLSRGQMVRDDRPMCAGHDNPRRRTAAKVAGYTVIDL